MEIESETVEEYNFSEYVNLLYEAELWDGRYVSWEQGSELYKKITEKFIQVLFSKDTKNTNLQQIALDLEWIGSDSQTRSLVEREIVNLHSFSQKCKGEIFTCGKKLPQKYKIAILIRIGLFAAGAVGAAIYVCTTAAPVVGAAAGAGAGTVKQTKPSKPAKTEIPSFIPKEIEPALNKYSESNIKPISALQDFPHKVETLPFIPKAESASDTFLKPNMPSIPAFQDSFPVPKKEFSNSLTSVNLSPDKVHFLKEGFVIEEEYIPYKKALDVIQKPEILEKLSSKCSSNPSWLKNLLKESTSPKIQLPKMNPSLIDVKRSRGIDVKGVEVPYQIGGINGILTTIEGAYSHGEYLQSFIPEKHKIEWVYNQTHGPIADVLEVAAFNYVGKSLNTARILQENWTTFNQKNKKNPEIKYLQFCHSQGALHVKNALMNSPKEIRDRVLVVAIAPAAVVPREICYNAFNYVSKNDPIPFMDLSDLPVILKSMVDVDLSNLPAIAESLLVQKRMTQKMIEMLEKKQQLIVLEPHPDEKGIIDHSFQSLTFKKHIKRHIEEHIKKKGEYE